MSSDDLVRDFLARGGEVQKLRPVRRKAGKRRIIRAKAGGRMAGAFKAGGRLS